MTLNGSPFLRRVEIAQSFFHRSRGLLGRDALPREHGLLILPCCSIHTLGMRFAIDAIFLNREGDVVRVVRDVGAGRFLVAGGRGAHATLELSAGWLPRDAVNAGDKITWTPV